MAPARLAALTCIHSACLGPGPATTGARWPREGRDLLLTLPPCWFPGCCCPAPGWGCLARSSQEGTLEPAGRRLCAPRPCCRLPWMSAGFLPAARVLCPGRGSALSRSPATGVAALPPPFPVAASLAGGRSPATEASPPSGPPCLPLRVCGDGSRQGQREMSDDVPVGLSEKAYLQSPFCSSWTWALSSCPPLNWSLCAPSAPVPAGGHREALPSLARSLAAGKVFPPQLLVSCLGTPTLARGKVGSRRWSIPLPSGRGLIHCCFGVEVSFFLYFLCSEH